jgi:hypothetical protein
MSASIALRRDDRIAVWKSAQGLNLVEHQQYASARGGCQSPDERIQAKFRLSR